MIFACLQFFPISSCGRDQSVRQVLLIPDVCETLGEWHLNLQSLLVPITWCAPNLHRYMFFHQDHVDKCGLNGWYTGQKSLHFFNWDQHSIIALESWNCSTDAFCNTVYICQITYQLSDTCEKLETVPMKLNFSVWVILIQAASSSQQKYSTTLIQFCQ